MAQSNVPFPAGLMDAGQQIDCKAESGDRQSAALAGSGGSCSA
jgi:hypothetical protein